MKAIEVSTYDLPQVEKSRRVTLPLRVNFAWTLLGNVGYAACQWGMLIVLAKLGTPAMVGQFALGLAVTAPIFMLANLQLRGIQATDTKGEYQFADYLGLRLLTIVLALCGVSGIVLGSGYRPETTLVVLVVGFAKATESLSDICYGLFQQHEQMDHIAKSMMLKGVLSLAALGVSVVLTQSVLWGTLAMTSVWVGLLIAYDLRQAHALSLVSSSRSTSLSQAEGLSTLFPLPHWHFATLLGLIRLSLPLGIVMMLISLNTNIPRYFVERILGEWNLGIYAALAYLMVAGNTPISALGQSASPRLARYYADGQRSAFCLLLLKLCGIGTISGIAGVLVAYHLGEEVLTFLYRPEYAAHADAFLWIMVASGINYVSAFLGYGMTAARYLKMQAPLSVTVTAVTLVMSALLVPRLGLVGAAQASVISAGVNVVGALLVNLSALRTLRDNRHKAK